MQGNLSRKAINYLFLKNEDVISIYLKTSVEELHERLLGNKSSRPLIAAMEEEELKEFIAKHALYLLSIACKVRYLCSPITLRTLEANITL